MASEQFSLCWDNFHKNMSSGMNSLLENEDLVDVTLAVEGKYLKAHKMVLSVCSPYFKELFKSNPCKHPIVFMKDVSYIALSDLLQFMYQGEVQVSQENLTTFIRTAEALQIKGLTGDGNTSNDGDFETEQQIELVEVEEQRTTRSKKQPSSTPLSATVVKKQRLNDTDDATSNKIEFENATVIEEDIEQLQYKTEPFETKQAIVLAEGTTEETFIDESFDETTLEDAEEYSVIETGEEPKAGTSNEVPAGEGQESAGTSKTKELMREIKRKPNMPRYIVDGFVFHVNIMKGTPPMIYLRCLEYKRLGCHARAVIPYDGSIQDIKLNKPHNHPPDITAEEKIIFLRELKEVIVNNKNMSNRAVYTTLSETYPNAARETPFETIRYKMSRWRRQSNM